MKSLIDVVLAFSIDIEIELRLDKCAVMVLKSCVGKNACCDSVDTAMSEHTYKSWSVLEGVLCNKR